MAEPVATSPTFEQALTQLEQVVRQLEDGQIGLEESLQRYEQGVELIRYCFTLLRKVEQRVTVLQGFDEAGQPITKPFAGTTE
jgi:exodeoxyribonuclease VII small subunit